MPSVRSNTKFKCNDCGTIVDFGLRLSDMRRCPNCNGGNWDQILVVLSCDFCATTQNVRWNLPCGNFKLPVAPGFPYQGFKGAWAACDVCKQFVDQNDREGLLTRAILMDPDKAHPLLQGTVRRAHNGYFTHRTGPPVLHQEEEHG